MAWRGLKGDLDMQAAYLAQISPCTIPTLFKLSLPPATLASVLKTLLQRLLPQEPSQGLAHLAALTTVLRFDMTLMCLPSKDKMPLSALWPSNDRVQQLGLDASQRQQLASLRASFRL